MEERMDVEHRFKYLRVMKERYWASKRKEKSRLLDEMVSVTGLCRKHLIVRMNSPGPYRRARRRQRGRVYGDDVHAVIAVIGDAMDWICAERLQPNLVKIGRHLAKFGECRLTPKLEQQLGQMSVSTLRRIMCRCRPGNRLFPQVRRGRRPERAIQAQVPVSIIPFDEPEAGHFEVDLVHHTTGGVQGDFICTLQFIDVLTGWSERFAISGHSAEAVWPAVQRFRHLCPIPVREIHVDNGSEFINAAFVEQIALAFPHAVMTRGRPGHCNDNRIVEQKNSSLVRAYLGNMYLHSPEHLSLLEAIYDDMRLYYNLYQPVLRQTERVAVVLANGVCSIRRKQDRAATPLDRLIRSRPPISNSRVLALQRIYETTNPRQLKRNVHARLLNLYRMCDAERRVACGLR